MPLNAKPIILWDNILIDADISASSEHPNYPASNLADWREFLFWQAQQSTEPTIQIDCGSPKIARALCVYGHNVYSQGQSLALYGINEPFEISQKSQDDWREFGSFLRTRIAQQIILPKDFQGFDLELYIAGAGNDDKVKVAIYPGDTPPALGDYEISQTEENGWAEIGRNGLGGIAQQIIVYQGIFKPKIRLKMKAVGSPTDGVKVSLYKGDDPETAELLEEYGVNVTTEDYYDVEFPDSYCEPGSYLVIVSRIGEPNADNYYSVRMWGDPELPTPYEGNCWQKYEESWVELNGDLLFIFSGKYEDEAGLIEKKEFTISYPYFYHHLKFDSELPAGDYVLVLSRTGAPDVDKTYETSFGVENPYEGKCWFEESLSWAEQEELDLYFILQERGDWTEIISLTNGEDFNSDEPILAVFEEKNYRYYKLEITGSGLTRISNLFLGNFLEFPHWPDSPFDPNSEELSVESALSQEGYLIGVVENYRKRRLTLEFKYLTDSWLREKFLPFWKNHIPKPFIFAWDYLNHPEESYLAQIAEPKLEAPYEPVYRSLRLELEGRV